MRWSQYFLPTLKEASIEGDDTPSLRLILQAGMVRQLSSGIYTYLPFGLAALRKVNVYEEFIAGAKEGFSVTIAIVPYLVAMLVAVGVLRASGVLDLALDAIAWLAGLFSGASGGPRPAFIEALPTGFMKPFSGSGARALMIETIKTHGVDSLAGRMAAVMQGCTETTFYVLAVYFGAVGIRRTRYAVTCGLLADAAGIIAAIIVTLLFFG